MLELEHCTIRPWRLDDVDALVRHADDPDIARFLRDRFPSPYTRPDAEEWLTGVTGERDGAAGVAMAIEVDGEACGGIGLEPGEDILRLGAELGFWLGKEHWGRGIMTGAVRAFTDWGFEHLGLVRIHAHCMATNPASARVLEKAGFTFEGRLRSAIYKGGEVLDALLYARVKVG